MRTVAIIQARMGSTRLPGKVLQDVAGQPLLQRVIDRTTAAQSVNHVVVATTTAVRDDVLVEFLEGVGCDAYRGSENDVLSRYFECAERYKADVIVRVTADDPLKDPQIIDRAVQMLMMDPALDYCSNTIQPTFPEGLDVEAFRFTALVRTHREAELPSEREHVTPYIWKHPDLFRVANFVHDRDLSDWRWTVDHPADLEFVKTVFSHFQSTPLVGYQDVIAWLDQHPELNLNQHGISRNQGYETSIVSEDHD